MKRWQDAWLAPAIVVGLAAALRLWQCDLTPFLDDEASLLSRGIELLDTGQIPVVGGAFSIGVREPPLLTLLLAPILAISRSPVWVTACFCVADAAATLLVYLTARRLAGCFAGFAAGLLYAVAPAAIYFTRRTDYYGLIPFFVALTMWCLVRAWQEHSAASLALALVATAFALQVHPIAAMLLPVWLATAIPLAHRLRSWTPLWPALLAIALSLAPYVWLQARSGWADAVAVVRFFQAPKVADWAAPAQAVTLVGGGIYQQLTGPREAALPAVSIDAAGGLIVALSVLGLLGTMAQKRTPPWMVLAAARAPSGAIQTRSHKGWWVVAALAVLPVLAGIRHTAAVLPYYMLPVVPAAAVLAGMALAAIPIRALGALALAAPVIWQIAGYVNFQQTVAEDGPRLAYGMPLRYELQAAALLDAPAGSRVFAGQEGNQSASFPYLTGFRYQISHVDSRYGLALPASGSSAVEYVLQTDGAPYEFLASHFGPPADTVRTPAGRPVFALFRLPADAAERVGGAAELTPVDADVAGAIRLRGYAVPALSAGKLSPALLEWAIASTPASLPAEVQQFLHLVDSQGATWSTEPDERAYPRREWRPGDMVLTWFDLAPKASAPTGGYWLDTGFYAFTTGTPLGGTTRLGPVRLGGVNPTTGPILSTFGDGELALTGVQRQGLAVTLQWSALKRPAQGYTVFVHLLDAAGTVVAQHDGPPQEGAFPTSLWQPGDVVMDVHHLAGESQGGQTLEIGLYRRPTLERLPVASPSGTPLGDHLHLPA